MFVQVTVGGYDVKDLNLQWLRSNIGVVSQEPVLFATTIAENICFGKDDVTEEEMIAAAEAANAHSFISQLPDGYNTLVGEMGREYSLIKGAIDLVQCITVHLVILNLSCQVSAHSDNLFKFS